MFGLIRIGQFEICGFHGGEGLDVDLLGLYACNIAGINQHFRGSHCLQLQSRKWTQWVPLKLTLKMQAVNSSETLVNTSNIRGV